MVDASTTAAAPRWRPARQWTASAAAFLLFVAVLWAPELINGFPIFYDDSGIYLGFPDTIDTAYPPFYAAGVWVLGRLASLHVVVLVQCLGSAFVLTTAFVRLSNVAWGRAVAAGTVVALLTQLPWLTAMIMPDFLGGIGLIALVVVVLHDGRRGIVDLVLCAMVVAAGITATSNILVMVPGLAILLVLRWLMLRRVGLWLAIAAPLLVVAMVVPPFAFNARFIGKPTLAMGSSARLLSKLINEGLAQAALRDECAKGDTDACRIGAAIAPLREDDEFQWGSDQRPTALADTWDVWHDYSGTYDRLCRRIIAHDPAGFVRSVLVGTGRLARALVLGPENRDFLSHAKEGTGAYGWIQAMYPGDMPKLLAARQQRGTLVPLFPRRLYFVATILSYLAVPLILVLAARRGDRLLLAVTAGTALLLIASTAVHGGLSVPIPRYTVKSSWLAMFVTVLALVRLLPWMRGGRADRAPQPL